MEITVVSVVSLLFHDQLTLKVFMYFVVFFLLPSRIISYSSRVVTAKHFEMRRDRQEKDSVQVFASTHDGCLTPRLRLWRRGYGESGAWKLVSNKSCHV